VLYGGSSQPTAIKVDRDLVTVAREGQVK